LLIFMAWLTVPSLVDAFLGCRSLSASPNALFQFATSHGCYRQDSVCGSFSTSTLSLLTNRFTTRMTRQKTTSRSGAAFTTSERGSGFVSGDHTVNVDVHFNDSSSGSDNQTVKPFGLYVHIPYCRQRCRYCDFAIVPIGDFGDKSGKTGTTESIADDKDSEDDDSSNLNGSISRLQQQSQREQGFRRMDDRYVSAIVAELKGLAASQAFKANGNRDKIPLRSIYFGGGTPSLAPIESIEKIMYEVCGIDNPMAPFRLLKQQQQQQQTQPSDFKETREKDIYTPKTEITMEMDPGTFDREYLSQLRDIGVNRVSLGVQSFDDDLLRAMGRTHRRADILQAVRDIAFVFGDYKTGEDDNNNDCWKDVNYSIDLISGCPGLTPAKWTETLQEATAGVYRKGAALMEATVNFTLPTTNQRQSLLLSSLPPPKHISVYDMQIEEGTVFGKWAEKAKQEADTKRKDSLLRNVPYDDAEDDDEDPSRRFTVKVPLEDSGVSRSRGSRKPNPGGKTNLEERVFRLPSEDDCAFMYKYAAGYLRAKNYEHYEVSSYAAFNDELVASNKNFENDSDRNYGSKTENTYAERDVSISKRSIHNQIYWEYNGQWFALGLGATSFIEKKSVARPREMSDYIEWVERGEERTPSDNNEDGHIGDEADDTDNDEDFLSDLLLKRLRTIDGLDLSWLEANHGSDIVDQVLEGAKLGLDLELAEHTDDNILRLKDPDGLLYSNFIISSIFAELGYI